MSDLPPGWEWTTLQDLAAPQPRAMTDGPFGSNLKSSHYVDSGPRVIRLQNIGFGEFIDEKAHITESHFENLRAHEARPGDLVVASLGQDLPRACLVPPTLGPAIVKADCIRVRLHPSLDARYVSYALQRPDLRHTVADQIHGVGRPRLGMAGIRALSVPVAPPAEQERIVAAIEEHLSRLDAALKAFDAICTKTAGFRRVALRDAFRLDAPVAPLEEVAQVVSGQTPKGLEAADEGSVPFFKVGDMNTADEGVLRLSRTMLSERSIAQLGLHLRPAGTVVFPKRGGAIATNKKRVLGCQAAFDLNTMGVIPGENLDGRYLRWWFEALDLASLADGSNVPQINHGDIAPLEIPVPALDEQRRVVSSLEAVEGHLLRLSRQVELARSRAGALRRVLLAAAFSGQLVPQDPDPEPALVLLKRIRAEREAAAPTKRSRKAKAS